MTDEELSKQTQDQYNDPDFVAVYAENIEGRLDSSEIDALLEELTPGSVILEAGCAAGRDVAYIASKGYKVTGIDLSAGLIAEAKRRHPDLDFVVGDFTQLPFEDNTFDAIWNRAALVHMPSQELVRKALSEFARVLKPGGPVSIRTKAKMEGQEATVLRKDKLSDRERFFRLQDKDQIEKDIVDAGFEIIDSIVYNEKDLADKYADPSKLRDENWVMITARKRS